MAFWIIFGIVIGVSAIAGYAVWKTESLSEGIACFLTLFVIGGLIGGLIWAAICGAARTDANRTETHREVIQVAQDSEFEVDDNTITFVEKTSKGTLEPREIRADEIKWDTKNVKEIEVVKNDLDQPAVSPFGLSPETLVTIR